MALLSISPALNVYCAETRGAKRCFFLRVSVQLPVASGTAVGSWPADFINHTRWGNGGRRLG
jgi:hypothetical protein